jgi:AhpD family alkylhydroperoxidase
MKISPRVDPTVRDASAMDRAILEFCETVERASSVDLMTTEVVRLRCAQYHNCRACASYRNKQALADGLDEALVEKIGRYEESDLPERWKAALRLADAVIVAPGGANAGLAADLHEHFSDEQIAELIFDVMKWSDQKVDVSLAMDIPPRDGLSVHSFDEDGHMVSHGPLMLERA